MKRLWTPRIILLLAAAAAVFSCGTPDERAARALARRVMGDKASSLIFEQTDTPEDAYELFQRGNKVVVRGNNTNSMAVGLNRYLQQYCLANVSWYDFNPVELPEVMPRVPEKPLTTSPWTRPSGISSADGHTFKGFPLRCPNDHGWSRPGVM